MVANRKSVAGALLGKPAVAPQRTGMTLLELLLALGLSVLVLMAIGMAIDLHYRMFDLRRTNVEEAQLANAALRHIADDLRSSIQYTPPDLEGLTAVAGNTATANMNSLFGSMGGTPTSGGAGGAGTPGNSSGNNNQSGAATQTAQPGGQGNQSGGQSGNLSAMSAAAGGAGQFAADPGSTMNPQGAGNTTLPDEEATTDNSTSVVGLYGGATELQFDISRLPRIDQYQALMMPGSLGAVDIPSDVKTVIYFLQSDDRAAADSTGILASEAQATPTPSTTGRGQGLMRSEIDRAVAAWTEENGGAQSLYAGAKLLAKEVTGLEFRYFDGVEWISEWDSSAMDGLPVAIEINLSLAPPCRPTATSFRPQPRARLPSRPIGWWCICRWRSPPCKKKPLLKLRKKLPPTPLRRQCRATAISRITRPPRERQAAAGQGQGRGQGGQGQNGQQGPGGQGGIPGVPGFGNGQGGFPGGQGPGGQGGQGPDGGRGNGPPGNGNFGPGQGQGGQGRGGQGQGQGGQGRGGGGGRGR